MALVAGTLAGFAVSAPTAQAVEPGQIWGVLTGRVTDSAGVPQMGASVVLYNRFERLVGKAVTNDRGNFTFDSLLPDSYSVRVSLASFVPALKRNISTQPGMKSFLAISLTSLLSSVELVYMAPGQHPIMSEEWKWVLRGSASTRPILRFRGPGFDITDPNKTIARRTSDMFVNTHGLFRLSTGDSGGILSNAGNQADLGTAFALATSVFGNHQVSVSGNVGYASHSGTPTAGFRTSFSSHVGGADPEVNVTMRQLFLPSRIGGALMAGQNSAIPTLQTLTVTFVDRRQLSDDVHVEFGSSLESVSFLNRLNFLSPFARLRYGKAETGALEFAYSSGAPATELLRGDDATNDAELQHDLTTLSLFPRVSLRGGLAHVQRTQNFEVGYRRMIGKRTVSISAYKEASTNTTMNASIPVDFFGPGELLPDLASSTSVMNAGRFSRMGYSAALTQHVNEKLSATVAYGIGGAMTFTSTELTSNDPEQLRGLIRTKPRQSLTARVSGVAPRAGTRYVASYQVTDYAALSPVHLSLTQRASLEPGLNFYLRQPVPLMQGMFPGRLEATAEIRNALGQGYISLATPGGQRVLLVQSPRAFRGGLSLIF